MVLYLFNIHKALDLVPSTFKKKKFTYNGFVTVKWIHRFRTAAVANDYKWDAFKTMHRNHLTVLEVRFAIYLATCCKLGLLSEVLKENMSRAGHLGCVVLWWLLQSHVSSSDTGYPVSLLQGMNFTWVHVMTLPGPSSTWPLFRCMARRFRTLFPSWGP